MNLTPRPYQVAAVNAVRAQWRAGCPRLLLILATGLGKTVVCSEIIRQEFNDSGGAGRVLFLAHRGELLEQARDKLSMIAPELQTKFIRGSQNDYDANVVFATIQTLSGEKRLIASPRDFAFVVVDEAHHVPAADYMRVLRHLGCFETEGPRLLGLTATPERTDGIGLDGVFEKVAYRMSAMKGIVEGYLCDLFGKRLEIQCNLKSVNVVGGDFDEKKLSRALLKANLDKVIVEAYDAHAVGRKTVVFVPSVELCEKVAAAFHASGRPAAAVHGEQSPADQKRRLREFAENPLGILVNALKLTEGWDEPSVSCVIVARPTQSSALYKQMVGRGMRLHPSKRNTLIVEIVPQGHVNSKLITLSEITGFPNEAIEAGLRSAKRRRDAQAQPAQSSSVHGKMSGFICRDLNLFAEMNWLPITDKGYSLALGDALLLLQLEPQTSPPRYRVLLQEKDTPPVVVNSGLPLEYAQGVGEDLVRERNAQALAVKGGKWRDAPATANQLLTLERMGVPLRTGLTKGAASDLITVNRGARVM
jgi:superfamily II DNA or RNA helicase